MAEKVMDALNPDRLGDVVLVTIAGKVTTKRGVVVRKMQ
jgi:hypothetical protein